MAGGGDGAADLARLLRAPVAAGLIAAIAYFAVVRGQLSDPGVADGPIVRVAVYIGLTTMGLVFAWRSGGAPERVIATAIALDVVLDPIGHLVLPVRFTAADPTHAVLNTAMAAVAVATALRANRHWPLPVAALTLFPLFFHYWEATQRLIPPLLYGALQVVWAYPPLFIVMAGTLRHRMRRRESGVDLSWMPSGDVHAIPDPGAARNG